MNVESAPITEWLNQLAGEDRVLADRVFALLYQPLRRMASARMAGERAGHTLTPTALVHEAWLRIHDGAPIAVTDRRHFLAIAARVMRQILIDHARVRSRGKRGGGNAHATLDQTLADPGTDPHTLLAIDQALTQLAAIDPDMAQVVELRFFAGLAIEEVAAVLGKSERGVNRDWTAARAWLGRALAG